jgi:hypothetical protein
MSDWINDLERLKALLDSGSISKSEFEASKARVLGSGERQPELASQSWSSQFRQRWNLKLSGLTPVASSVRR